VRVAPRSSSDSVGGVRDGALLVRVTAPPVEGAANDALIAALSRALGVARRDLTIESGGRGRSKTVSAPLAARAALERLGT
jgi:hypothetical protein